VTVQPSPRPLNCCSFRRRFRTRQPGDLFLQPGSGADCLDLLRGDEGRPTTISVCAGSGAVVRPLEGRVTLWVQFLEQVVNEQARRIHTSIAGVQPKPVFTARALSFCLELPLLRRPHQGLGKVLRQLLVSVSNTGFVGQAEGMRLLCFARQVDDDAEVGEVISHIPVFLS